MRKGYIVPFGPLLKGPHSLVTLLGQRHRSFYLWSHAPAIQGAMSGTSCTGVARISGLGLCSTLHQHSTNIPHIVDAGLHVPTDEAQERREIKQFGSAGVGEHRVSERLLIRRSEVRILLGVLTYVVEYSPTLHCECFCCQYSGIHRRGSTPECVEAEEVTCVRVSVFLTAFTPDASQLLNAIEFAPQGLTLISPFSSVV